MMMSPNNISVIQDLPSSQNTVTGEVESPPSKMNAVKDKDEDGTHAFLEKAKSMPRTSIRNAKKHKNKQYMYFYYYFK